MHFVCVEGETINPILVSYINPTSVNTILTFFILLVFPDLWRGGVRGFGQRRWLRIICIISGGEGEGGNAVKSNLSFFKRMCMKQKSWNTPTCLIDGNILCLKLRQGMGEEETLKFAN